jgi:serine/threonine protein kinase
MSIDSKRVRDVFLAVAELPEGERAAYLAEACGRDAELRSEVEQLLAAHAEPASVLRAVAEVEAGSLPSTGPHAPTTEAGTVLGKRYTLLEEIGEGGMGTVWMARQSEPVKRKVAIKLIKPGMDTKVVLARFEAERQALALMDHPNIARVLDGGVTADGRPFFVMDLVKGVPITQYCDDHRLTVGERLELFLPVCQAIQHAHQKGIIHRDIKPSNVLVALYDDCPVPKVIDFGVAKAIGQPLTEQTFHTGFGTVIGTPSYMSPEQATFNNLDVDTRSDIYSLGVLLYELLVGAPPFSKKDLERAGMLEMLRVVREVEPPRPSTKLSTAKKLPTLAAQRNTEPKKLTGLLRNELDWVVMKSLEKDRKRRYETANGFAADILRYLSGEAVLAVPPSMSYRLRKFTLRHRIQVIAASLLLLSLIAGITGTTLGLVRADQKRQDAEFKEQEANVEKLKAIAAGEAEKEARIREAEQRVRAVKARNSARQALDAMTSTTTTVDSLSAQQEVSPEQKKFLTEVLTYYKEFAGETADDEQSRAQTASAALRVGIIEGRLVRNAEAMAAVRQARTLYEKLVVDFPSKPEYRSGLAKCEQNLELVFYSQGNFPEAAEQAKKALAMYEKLVAEFPAEPEYRRRLARSHEALGILSLRLTKPPKETEPHFRTAFALLDRLVAEFPNESEYRGELISSEINLGISLGHLGMQVEAEAEFRKAVAFAEKLAADFHNVPEHRMRLVSAYHRLAEQLAQMGKLPEAEAEFRKALLNAEKLVADFPARPDFRASLAGCGADLGRRLLNMSKIPEAESELRKALAIQEKLVADYPLRADYRNDLGAVYYNLGIALGRRGIKQLPEAEVQFRKSIAIFEKLVAESPHVAEYRRHLAKCHVYLGGTLNDKDRKGPQWEVEFRISKAICEILVAEFPANPECREELGVSQFLLGITLQKEDRRPEAVEQIRQALRIQEKLVLEFPSKPEYRPYLAKYQKRLVGLLSGMGQVREAEEEYLKGLAIQETYAAASANALQIQVDLGVDYSDFAAFLRQNDRSGDSLEWFEKSIRTLKAVLEIDPKLAAATGALGTSHASRAMVYDHLKKYAEAIKDWDKAIEFSAKPQQPQLRAGRALSYAQAGRVEEAVAEAREAFPKDSPESAGVLAQVGMSLLERKKLTEAEPLFRECLAIRERKQPDAWTTFNTKSMLGGTLLGQKKYTDAEPLMLKGYEGMKQREKTIPPQGQVRLPEALDRLIELYTATNKPEEAKKWRAERAKYPAAPLPVAPQPREKK